MAGNALELRRWPVGAEVIPSHGVHFRVWAPRCRSVSLLLEDESEPSELVMESEGTGYFSLLTTNARTGSLYRFTVDHTEGRFPDPISRFQPHGPHGPSQVVDATQFEWHDFAWSGVSMHGQVIYELHIGTFTVEGTYQAALEKLPSLKDLGITVVELLPVAEFPGKFGWGYDGVDLFAPTHLYGTPDDLRQFVDRAHQLGLGVLMDVVYNHFGPEGNYLRTFSDAYFSQRHSENPWGETINFDDKRAAGVREYFSMNAAYWIDEFHCDGLRLDATQCIFDDSAEHILTACNRWVKEAAGSRSTVLIAENPDQASRFVQPIDENGLGLEGIWDDDFHHAARVALTGRGEYFLSDFRGTASELWAAIRHGFAFQGQYTGGGERRGEPAWGIPAERFVKYLENHDQVSNHVQGKRLRELCSPAMYRALTALWLLAPGTPMFFQGQEFGSTTPFVFFADLEARLEASIDEGRKAFLKSFRSQSDPANEPYFPRPGDRATFERCKLDWTQKHEPTYQLHRDLLQLRRDDPLISAQCADWMHGATLNSHALAIRIVGHGRRKGEHRLILTNLGSNFLYNPAPEPLLAPPTPHGWKLEWSSEHPSYGGIGTTEIETVSGWELPGQSTIVLRG